MNRAVVPKAGLAIPNSGWQVPLFRSTWVDVSVCWKGVARVGNSQDSGEGPGVGQRLLTGIILKKVGTNGRHLRA